MLAAIPEASAVDEETDLHMFTTNAVYVVNL